jgi:hypothetical protein
MLCECVVCELTSWVEFVFRRSRDRRDLPSRAGPTARVLKRPNRPEPVMGPRPRAVFFLLFFPPAYYLGSLDNIDRLPPAVMWRAAPCATLVENSEQQHCYSFSATIHRTPCPILAECTLRFISDLSHTVSASRLRSCGGPLHAICWRLILHSNAEAAWLPPSS